MPEDRSLDDFAGTDGADPSTSDSEDAEPTEDTAPSDDGDLGGADDAPDADPAVATATWHADGAACDRCGERVERRWRDGDAFVCADCAAW